MSLISIDDSNDPASVVIRTRDAGSRPRRSASSALIRDPHGRVLIVEPNYRDGWTLPGGTVEAGEDPRTGCFREVLEEVGLQLPEGRLLVVAHGLAAGIWGDSVAFLYDGGVIPEDTEILFLPDQFLGAHVKRETGRDIVEAVGLPGEWHATHAPLPTDVSKKALDSAQAIS